MLVVALISGSGFAALAGLVAAGSVSSLDAYVVRHWMPALTPAQAAHEPSLTGALVPFYGLRSPTHLDLATAIVTLPAYILVSAALYAGGLWLLARRGATVEAALLGVAFVVGNLAEVVSKGLLTRPPLSAPEGDRLVHLVAFDASYPSGHALRTCLLAALVLRLWPRAWSAVTAWTAASLVLLVAAGVHAVTDVVGGALLAGFVVALAASGRASKLGPARR